MNRSSLQNLLARLVVSAGAGLAALLILLPLTALLWRGIAAQAWALTDPAAVTQALALSLGTSLLSLGLIIGLGTPLAWVLARRAFRGRRALNALVELPIVLPPAVAGLALLMAFGRRGLLGPLLDGLGITVAFDTPAVILAQVFVAMPFYVRSAQTGFAGVDREVEDAALVDGATRWWTFIYVTVPLAGRALLNGALLSWARALGEFGATIIFAGSLAGRTRTMPLLIYAALEQDLNAAVWTALILVALAVALTVLTRWVVEEDEGR